jgi:hypothetical protein
MLVGGSGAAAEEESSSSSNEKKKKKKKPVTNVLMGLEGNGKGFLFHGVGGAGKQDEGAF